MILVVTIESINSAAIIASLHILTVINLSAIYFWHRLSTLFTNYNVKCDLDVLLDVWQRKYYVPLAAKYLHQTEMQWCSHLNYNVTILYCGSEIRTTMMMLLILIRKTMLLIFYHNAVSS